MVYIAKSILVISGNESHISKLYYFGQEYTVILYHNGFKTHIIQNYVLYDDIFKCFL